MVKTPIAGLFILLGAAFAQVAPQESLFPPAGADLQPPANAPAIPGAAPEFKFSGKVAENAPAIAAWDESAQSDETITLTGSRFTLSNGAAEGNDTQVWVSNGGAPVQAKILEARRMILTVTLPAGFEYGMYLLWVKNSAGFSEPVALNRTNAQWLGPLGNKAAAGSSKRVFGKDLSFGHGTATSYVYLQAAGGGQFVSTRVTAVEPYAVEFQIPERLANGKYSVFVHNGHGGRLGWSAPLPLQVEPEWVRGSGVARVPPSGSGDDTSAIQAAMDRQAASSNGGTVQLGDGVYTITSGITIPANVRLMGDGKDRTTIEIRLYHVSDGAVNVNGNHVEIRGLGLKMVSDGRSVAPGHSLFRGSQWPHMWEDIALKDVRFCATGKAESNWGNGNNLLAKRLEIADSELFREIVLNESDNWVHNSVFHGGTYQGREAGSEGAISVQAMRGLVLENNHFETPSDPDWASPSSIGLNIARRVISANIHFGSIVDAYIAHNTSKNVMAPANENKGEMLLFHGEGAPWYGQVVSNADRTMTVRTDGLVGGQMLALQSYGARTYSGPLSDTLTQTVPYKKIVVLKESGTYGQVGMFVTVVNGTGLGQIRQVESVTANSIQVTSPWRVPPDATSNVVLNYVYKDIVIYKNELDAFPPGAPGRSSASVFVQFGGASWFNVVDGNVSHRAYGGAMVAASPLSPSWWNEIIGNRFLELRDTGLSLTFWETAPEVVLIGPATLGNVFRNNTIEISGPQHSVVNPDWIFQLGSVGGNWKGNRISAPYPYHLGNIFENNKASGGRTGIMAGDWADTVYRKNSVTVDSSTTERPSPPFTPTPLVTRPQALPVMIDNLYSAQH